MSLCDAPNCVSRNDVNGYGTGITNSIREGDIADSIQRYAHCTNEQRNGSKNDNQNNGEIHYKGRSANRLGGFIIPPALNQKQTRGGFCL